MGDRDYLYIEIGTIAVWKSEFERETLRCRRKFRCLMMMTFDSETSGPYLFIDFVRYMRAYVLADFFLVKCLGKWFIVVLITKQMWNIFWYFFIVSNMRGVAMNNDNIIQSGYWYFVGNNKHIKCSQDYIYHTWTM